MLKTCNVNLVELYFLNITQNEMLKKSDFFRNRISEFSNVIFKDIDDLSKVLINFLCT